LRAGRLPGGGVGGIKVPPDDVILISSDDESSDGETYDYESYDDESYDDESSDDESSDEQQKSGTGCPPATDAASLVEHKAARPDHGCQRDPRPFAEPCGTTSNDDNSKCLSHNERDKRHFGHDVQDPSRAAFSQEEARQKSDGRYRSASHDHHGDGDQTSGSARRHPPVPDETGERTENDPVRLLQVQERRASPSVLPDHQSIGEPKPADVELRFQYRSPPSAASEHGAETQHRNHHDDSNQTNDLKQGDARLPSDRGEQSVGSSVATSQVQESGARIPRSPEAMSNNDRMLADVGPPVQPSARPSASQDRVRLQQSLGRRRRSGTDVGENHSFAEDGVKEHDRENVTQSPPKRLKISTSGPCNAPPNTAQISQAAVLRSGFHDRAGSEKVF
jgi:hypothetical protein